MISKFPPTQFDRRLFVHFWWQFCFSFKITLLLRFVRLECNKRLFNKRERKDCLIKDCAQYVVSSHIRGLLRKKVYSTMCAIPFTRTFVSLIIALFFKFKTFRRKID